MLRITFKNNALEIEGLEELIHLVRGTSTLTTEESPPIKGFQTEIVAVPSEDLGELPAEPVKRGRGRPRKEAAADTPPATTSAPTTSPEPLSDTPSESSTEAISEEKPSSEPTPKPKSKATRDDAVRVAAGVIRTHGATALKNVFQSMGVTKASELPDEQIQNFIDACEMLE